MREQSAAQELAFEERLTLLLEREQLHRENRRLMRLLQLAQLKERTAVIEDIDYHSGATRALRVRKSRQLRVGPRRPSWDPGSWLSA